MSPRILALPLLALLLAGCDIPGLGPDPRIAQREADAKAVGGACRHALRGIEDCYSLNPKAAKSSVFAGWKDMDQYMRENKIEGSRSAVAQSPAATGAANAGGVELDASIDKTTEKVLTPSKPKPRPTPL